MQRYVIVLLLVLIVLVVIVYQQKDQITYILTGKQPIDTGGPSTGKMQLTSVAFSQNGDIPKLYTCEGSDLSPPLTINGAPGNAKSLAIIVDDPQQDAPDGAWVHWVAWNIPANTGNIAQGIAVGTQGANSGGELKYAGPCPPGGPAHKYRFKLYALDTTLTLNAGATKKQLEQAMQGHILDSTELDGLYAVSGSIVPPMPPINTTVPPPPKPPQPDVKKIDIPPNTLMLFYFTSVGQGTESLPSLVSGTEYGGGYSNKHIYITGQPITWDTDYYAIIGHIPSLSQTYLVDKTTSYSYARSVLHVKTIDDRVFVLNERGDRNPGIKDIDVKDSLTGKKLKYLSLYPESSVGSWAIVGDTIFYHDPIVYGTDPYSFPIAYAEKRVGGGHLYKRDLDATSSVKLLDYGDSSNVGKLYGVGNKLFTVDGSYNSDTKLTTYNVREHSTSTGKIIKELTSFPAPSIDTEFYDGETALYFSLKDPSANTYAVYRITSGEPEFLFSVTLRAGETGLGQVDESNGYLIVPILSSGTDTLVIYNVDEKKGEEDILINIKGDIGSAEYLILNPQ